MADTGVRTLYFEDIYVKLHAVNSIERVRKCQEIIYRVTTMLKEN